MCCVAHIRLVSFMHHTHAHVLYGAECLINSTGMASTWRPTLCCRGCKLNSRRQVGELVCSGELYFAAVQSIMFAPLRACASIGMFAFAWRGRLSSKYTSHIAPSLCRIRASSALSVLHTSLVVCVCVFSEPGAFNLVGLSFVCAACAHLNAERACLCAATMSATRERTSSSSVCISGTKRGTRWAAVSVWVCFLRLAV